MTDWRDEHETYSHTESPIILELQNKIAILISERDEARREVCSLVSCEDRPYYSRTPEEFAKYRGWDCFKKDGK